MEEFLRLNYSKITLGVEVLAAVTGLLLFKKYRYTAAKYFIYFLVYIVFCAYIARYVKYINNEGFLNFLEGTVFQTNHWWSTLTWKIGAVVFFSFLYQKILKRERDKYIVKYSRIGFLLFSLLYIILNFKAFFTQFFPIISVLGAIVILTCAVLYFMQMLKSERILDFYKSLNFYISSAILLWWLIITPLIFFDIYFSKSDLDFVFLKWQIYLFANIFMYTTFTIGLIVSKPEESK
ncbi:hypothetical protein [uncultured Lacinutrix sp.]|uniref:hypothetical protein n=1 Tax=uncultured Lacinutrix sp. TaxID=574032 RepID=UPI0026311508|nr:hypothetical protein [uncultured Lacinutrix sp.]